MDFYFMEKKWLFFLLIFYKYNFISFIFQKISYAKSESDVLGRAKGTFVEKSKKLKKGEVESKKIK